MSESSNVKSINKDTLDNPSRYCPTATMPNPSKLNKQRKSFIRGLKRDTDMSEAPRPRKTGPSRRMNRTTTNVRRDTLREEVVPRPPRHASTQGNGNGRTNTHNADETANAAGGNFARTQISPGNPASRGANPASSLGQPVNPTPKSRIQTGSPPPQYGLGYREPSIPIEWQQVNDPHHPFSQEGSHYEGLIGPGTDYPDFSNLPTASFLDAPRTPPNNPASLIPRNPGIFGPYGSRASIQGPDSAISGIGVPGFEPGPEEHSNLEAGHPFLSLNLSPESRRILAEFDPEATLEFPTINEYSIDPAYGHPETQESGNHYPGATFQTDYADFEGHLHEYPSALAETGRGAQAEATLDVGQEVADDVPQTSTTRGTQSSLANDLEYRKDVEIDPSLIFPGDPVLRGGRLRHPGNKHLWGSYVDDRPPLPEEPTTTSKERINFAIANMDIQLVPTSSTLRLRYTAERKDYLAYLVKKIGKDSIFAEQWKAAERACEERNEFNRRDARKYRDAVYAANNNYSNPKENWGPPVPDLSSIDPKDLVDAVEHFCCGPCNATHQPSTKKNCDSKTRMPCSRCIRIKKECVYHRVPNKNARLRKRYHKAFTSYYLTGRGQPRIHFPGLGDDYDQPENENTEFGHDRETDDERGRNIKRMKNGGSEPPARSRSPPGPRKKFRRNFADMFRCPHCGQQYKYRTSWAKHIKLMHRGMPFPVEHKKPLVHTDFPDLKHIIQRPESVDKYQQIESQPWFDYPSILQTTLNQANEGHAQTDDKAPSKPPPLRLYFWGFDSRGPAQRKGYVSEVLRCWEAVDRAKGARCYKPATRTCEAGGAHVDNHMWSVCADCREAQGPRHADVEQNTLQGRKGWLCGRCIDIIVNETIAKPNTNQVVERCICELQLQSLWLCDNHRRFARLKIDAAVTVMEDYRIRMRTSLSSGLACCECNEPVGENHRTDVWSCKACQENVAETGWK